MALRNDLRADQYCARRVRLEGKRPYKRNEESTLAIASGMMKILFLHGEVSDPDFIKYCSKLAIELRHLVWDRLYVSDAEYRQYEATIDVELLGSKVKTA